MNLTIGDKGPVVRFINAYFGLLGDEYTQETENRVKQFQQSHHQIYENPVYNPYARDNDFNKYTKLIKSENCDTYKVDVRQILPVLWPNGLVDLQTMTAILETDIPYHDYQKIKSVRQALNGTEYSNFENIFLMLCEMAMNLDFRLDTNTDFVPVMVDGKIMRIVEDETLHYGGSDQIFEQDDMVDHHLAEFIIHGNNILEGSPYRTKTGQTVNIKDIDPNDTLLYKVVISNLSDLSKYDGTQSMQNSLQIEPIRSCNIILTANNYYTKPCLEVLQENLIGRIVDNSYQNEQAFFTIIPGNYDYPLNIPKVGDYINDNKRSGFINIGTNSAKLIRNIEGTGDFNFTEYIVWMDNYYRIRKIDEISTNESGIKSTELTAPETDCTKLLYLCCANEDDNVIISNLGVYVDAFSHNVRFPDLLNVCGIKDEYDAISGKYIKRCSKLSVTPDTQFEEIHDSENNTSILRIKSDNLKDINTGCVVCNYFQYNTNSYPKLEFDDEFGTFQFVFGGYYDYNSLKEYIDNLWEQEKTIDIYYAKNSYEYHYNNPSQIYGDIYTSVFTDNTDINLSIQHKLNPNLQVEDSDLIGPNPYHAPLLFGVGEKENNIKIMSENKNGEIEITDMKFEHALYKIGDIEDKWNATDGIYYSNISRLNLTGNELSIDVHPTSNDIYTVFSITNVMKNRALSYEGFSNYFLTSDHVLDGTEQGFTYDSSAPQNVYISVDNTILDISVTMNPTEKIKQLRNWAKECELNGNPISFLWVYNQEDNQIQTDTYKIPQYRHYTRIYNEYNSNMEIRLNVVLPLNRGEVIIGGLYEEGVTDLSDSLPNTFEKPDYGMYDSHLIKSIRLFQKTHDIGQDCYFGRYYSGVLDVPTYNRLKLEFGIKEEVIG